MNVRNLILLSFLILASFNLFGGDDPCNSTLINTSLSEFVEFDNSTNGESGIETPPYGNYSGPDTWVSFIMPTSGTLSFLLEEGSMTNIAIAVYEGPCDDLKLIYNVIDNNCDESEMPAILFDNLESGQEYFIRLWPEVGTSDGTFSLFLGENLIDPPGFITYGDAIPINDNCIQLTAEQGNQIGCAWFENLIDFTMPFTHTMTLNFGDKDINGADGICLIYQTNGPNYCGSSGEGIGAQGMPNSVIFEFDTWQNGNLNDPFQDHTSMNLNGNMNHNVSLEGPVILGNIEDGDDHEVIFTWEPFTNSFELFFDGNLVLSGSYDLINLAFNGETTAWWGYTSATGGANNLQVICPDYFEVFLGTQEYQEVKICDGESYNGYSESGFYINYVSGQNGCDHQINTSLIVIDEIPITNITSAICDGDYFYYENQILEEPDLYTFNLLSIDGCDSIVSLDLEVVYGYLDLDIPEKINCENESVTLLSDFITNIDEDNIYYNWVGPSGTSNDDYFDVNLPGNYFLTVEIIYGGKSCFYTESLTVSMDTLSPDISVSDDLEIDCKDSSAMIFVVVNGNQNLFDINWYLEGEYVSSSYNLNVNSPGTYLVEVVNEETKCVSLDSVVVNSIVEYPNIVLLSDTLNCYADSVQLNLITNDIGLSYNWLFQNELISTDSTPYVSVSGQYTLEVTNEFGCKTIDQTEIYQDFVIPNISFENDTIKCDIDTLIITSSNNPAYDYQWYKDNNFISEGIGPTFNQGGIYVVEALDLSNGCINRDTIEIVKLGNSPNIVLLSDTLNCKKPSINLTGLIDSLVASFIWNYKGSFFSNEIFPSVEDAGVYELVVVTESGCQSNNEIEIYSDFTLPVLSLSATKIDCDNPNSMIEINADLPGLAIWTGPNDFEIEALSFESSIPGTYYAVYTNGENGCIRTDSIEIISDGIVPSFQLNSDTLDCNQPEINIDFEVYNEYVSLKWNGPNGFISSEESPLIVESGLYTIEILGEGNCLRDTSVIIYSDFQENIPQVSYDSISCSVPFATINLDFSLPTDSIVWELPNGGKSYGSELYTDIEGVYQYFIFNKNGCNSKGELELKDYSEIPEFSIEEFQDLACNNLETQIVLNTNQLNTTVVWQGPNGFTSNNYSININNPGDYIIKVTNEYGCVKDTTLSVGGHFDIPNLEIVYNHLDCKNGTGSAQILSDDEWNFIIWTGPSNYQSSTYAINIPAGDYNVYVISEYGCENSIDFTIEDLTSYPDIALKSEEIIFYEKGKYYDIDIALLSDVEDIESIQWYPSDFLSCDTCLSPQYLGQEDMSYEVVVINKQGCESTLRINTKELLIPDIVEINVPNIFSPNNDANNDYFTIYSGQADQILEIRTMQIFDRWGSLVFLANHIPINQEKEGWDGKMKGNLPLTGVYAYYGEVLLLSGEIIKVVGDVTLIR